MEIRHDYHIRLAFTCITQLSGDSDWQSPSPTAKSYMDFKPNMLLPLAINWYRHCNRRSLRK